MKVMFIKKLNTELPWQHFYYVIYTQKNWNRDLKKYL